MAINISKGCGPYVFKCAHDPNSKVYYTHTYRPRIWQPNKYYIKDVDIVIPTTPNGMAYQIDSGGISGANEPAWIVIEGKKTEDNTVTYKAEKYDYFLDYGDSVVASTWTGATGVSFDNDSIVGGIQTKARLVSVPTDAKSITIVNHVTINRVNGDVEEYDRSLILNIKNN